MPDIKINGLPDGYNRDLLVSRLTIALLGLENLGAQPNGLLITCPSDSVERSPRVLTVDTKMVNTPMRDDACLKAFAKTVEGVLRAECPSATILIWPPELVDRLTAGFLRTTPGG
jgi:hypothetical protein